MESTNRLPDDLFARTAHPPFAPAARREMEFHGAPIELVWLPERIERPGVPAASRPSFRPDAAERIVHEEAIWRGDGVAVTANPYPFAARQLLLWATRPAREPAEAVLRAAFEFTTATRSTALMNSIGAAASLARAHLHLIGERLPFLPALRTVAVSGAWLPDVEGVEVRRAAPPFPACLVALRGTPAARARALRDLLDRRMTPSFNAVDDGETAWLLPRSNAEITAPWFPQALGSAELWGRWCFLDEVAYRRADHAALDSALALAGRPDPIAPPAEA